MPYGLPSALQGPLFTLYGTQFPKSRSFIMLVAVLMLVSVWLLLTRTRIGLVIQAALKHPEMVEALGHNVPRVFMLVFGGGAALAGLAGVVGGNTYVTEPAMAASVGSIIFVVVVVGGMGSLAGAFLASLTTYMKDQPEIKKVYLLNQNYAHGQQVSKFAKDNLKTKRPDVQIVGDDLHPLAQVRDFSPYIAKIKASGADTVITGNWGSDLALLIKAANDSGLNVKFYTYYAVTTGTPTAMGAASDGKVYQVGYAHYNMGGDMQKYADDFKKKFNDDLYTTDIYTVFQALTEAFVKTKSTDPVKVAAAMEGMKFKSFNGEIELRKTDHQAQQGLYIAKWEKASAKYPYSPENTGYTLVPVKYYDAYVASTPTSCQMKRPG